MAFGIYKSNNESSVNHYYEATIYKLRRSGITSANDFILLYDTNLSYINAQLGNCQICWNKYNQLNTIYIMIE